MAPLTRRQSRRLTESLAADQAGSADPGSKRDSLRSVAGNSGRVAKPERKGRVVASRYMSAAKPQRAETPAPGSTSKTAKAPAAPRTTATSTARNRPAPSTTTARPTVSRPAVTKPISSQQQRATPRPAARSQPATSKASLQSNGAANTPAAAAARLDRRVSRRTTVGPAKTAQDGAHNAQYAEYLQWLMIEARSQIAYDEAKDAATEEIDQLAAEAETAKQALLEEQRKLKLMRELFALQKWMDSNQPYLESMLKQIDSVRSVYSKFSSQLAQTTRAMPISHVHCADPQLLVQDISRFADTVAQRFPKDQPSTQHAYLMASKLRSFYRAQQEEQELLCECRRLKESLEHATALAVSQGLRN
ncbi:hypothetical protein IWW36_005150 [Coemansia brasiliensis]|uniref:Uncharacterized protein n=1 Tax=Coemansia brasiliensis TaxID=2650707 RepID=A0A9W8LWY0_9FUNG|nr:hypothetical protein IWW36_005150 [Coemansia brasiliensis]